MNFELIIHTCYEKRCLSHFTEFSLTFHEQSLSRNMPQSHLHIIAKRQDNRRKNISFIHYAYNCIKVELLNCLKPGQ